MKGNAKRWNPPLNVFKQILDSNAPKPSNVCCNFHAVYSAPLEIWIINAFYASPICTIHKDVKAPSLHYIVNSFIYIMACMSVRYRPRFLNKLGMKPCIHLGEISIFSHWIMSSSDLPKFWTEPTKIGHIFRKQSTLKIKVFKKFHL